MPLGAFYDEIAILLADRVIGHADALTERVKDAKERRRLNKEWARVKASPDWFDQLVRERVELHNDRSRRS